MTWLWVLGAVVITLIIAVPVTAIVATNRRKKYVEAKLGDADTKAREIIDEALKTAEAKKRESLLEIKEESIRTKNELDKEIKERRADAQRYERRIQQKEENIDKKADAIAKKYESQYEGLMVTYSVKMKAITIYDLEFLDEKGNLI